MRIAISPALAHLFPLLEKVGPGLKSIPVVDITLLLVTEHTDWWDMYARRLSPFYCQDEESALRVYNSLRSHGNRDAPKSKSPKGNKSHLRGRPDRNSGP